MDDRINISPKEWGNKFWDVMYYIALTYPTYPTETVKQSAKNFYTSLGNLLPCQTCREHYTSIIHRNPIDNSLESRYALTAWVVMINNKVNDRLGKKLVTVNEILEKYFSKKEDQNRQLSYVKFFVCLALIIAVIVTITILFLKNKKPI